VPPPELEPPPELDPVPELEPEPAPDDELTPEEPLPEPDPPPELDAPGESSPLSSPVFVPMGTVLLHWASARAAPPAASKGRVAKVKAFRAMASSVLALWSKGECVASRQSVMDSTALHTPP
jgi:hypothetical protein